MFVRRCEMDAGRVATGSSPQLVAEPKGSRRTSPVSVGVGVAGTQEILVLPHPVAVAADVDDMAVVEKAVDERRPAGRRPSNRCATP